MTCHFVLPFSVVLGRQSHCEGLKQVQRDPKSKRLMMHGKTILKPGVDEIAKA